MAGVSAAGTIGATSVGSVGMGASRGSTGSAKGAGVSLSGEAPRGGPKGAITFSSKGLGTESFKGASYKSAVGAMFDTNHGKGKSSPFARSTELAAKSKSSMLDISRPAFEGRTSRALAAPLAPKAEAPVSKTQKAIEFKSTPRVREIVAMPTLKSQPEARKATHISPRNEAFRIAPVHVDLTPGRVVSIAPKEAKATPKPTPEAFRSFGITVDKQNGRSVTSKVARATSLEPKKGMIDLSKNADKVKGVQKKTIKSIVSERIVSVPSRRAAEYMKHDMQYAEKTVDVVMAAFPGTSDEKAKEIVARILSKKFQKMGATMKTEIQPATKIDSAVSQKTATSPQTASHIETDARLESQVQALTEPLMGRPTNTKKETQIHEKAPEDPLKEFSFAKDYEVDGRRVTAISEAAASSFGDKERDFEEHPVSGQDIVAAMGAVTPDLASEMVQPGTSDGSLEEIVQEVAKQEFKSVSAVRSFIEWAVSQMPAVRLSIGEANGSREQAEKVLGGAISGQQVYFKENSNARGQLSPNEQETILFQAQGNAKSGIVS